MIETDSTVLTWLAVIAWLFVLGCWVFLIWAVVALIGALRGIRAELRNIRERLGAGGDADAAPGSQGAALEEEHHR